MKNIAFFLLLITAGFADRFTLDNLTAHPAKPSKMAIQWASSAKEMEEGNHALRHGLELNALQVINKIGKISFTAPAMAGYFRVLVWSNGKAEPDLHTNWVEIVPDKTYTLEAEHLIPSVLMLGMGC
jgi:hypothetical protein